MARLKQIQPGGEAKLNYVDAALAEYFQAHGYQIDSLTRRAMIESVVQAVNWKPVSENRAMRESEKTLE